MIGWSLVRRLEVLVTALRRAVMAEVEDVYRLVSHVLRAGLGISVALLVAGLAIALAGNAELPRAADFPPPILEDVMHLRPAGLLNLGVLVLISTPIARVALSLAVFVRDRDRRFVVIASAVLLNLLLGLAIGLA